MLIPVSSESAGKLPDYWDDMATGETCKLVVLLSTSTEYQQVEQKFKTSMTAGGSNYNAIVEVREVHLLQ